MRTFKYHSKNLPTLYRTHEHARCRACGAASGCKSNYQRTAYLRKQVPSANHIESHSAWVHRYERKRSEAGQWTNFFESCERHHDSVVRDALCTFLGVDLNELSTYPFGYDPVLRLAALPAMSEPGCYIGINLFSVNGPKPTEQFMLRGSYAGPTFPARPPQSGPFVDSLLCAFDLGDALQAQALGFNTCAQINACVTDEAAAAVGRYAIEHGCPDIVMVSRPTNEIRDPALMDQAAKKLNKFSNGLSVFDAEVPVSMKNFAEWASQAGFSPGQRLPGQRPLHCP